MSEENEKFFQELGQLFDKYKIHTVGPQLIRDGAGEIRKAKIYLSSDEKELKFEVYQDGAFHYVESIGKSHKAVVITPKEAEE